jgi:hypothetical protein
MFSAVAAIADFAYPFPTNIPDGRAASTLAGNPGPLYRIAQASGLVAQNLRRFLRGGVSIQLDTTDRLAAYLGLQLVPDPDAKPPEPTPANLARPALAKRRAKRKAN